MYLLTSECITCHWVTGQLPSINEIYESILTYLLSRCYSIRIETPCIVYLLPFLVPPPPSLSLPSRSLFSSPPSFLAPHSPPSLLSPSPFTPLSHFSQSAATLFSRTEAYVGSWLGSPSTTVYVGTKVLSLLLIVCFCSNIITTAVDTQFQYIVYMNPTMKCEFECVVHVPHSPADCPYRWSIACPLYS